MEQISLVPQSPVARAISPLLEMGAYEALWMREGATVKSVADLFRKQVGALPSDFVTEAVAREAADWVLAHATERGLKRFQVRMHQAGEYPQKLRDARHPAELLYFRGIWNLVEAPCIAIVGTRNPSAEGEKRARRLARELSEAGFTIVSGLARGIDTIAHRAALDAATPTIAVIGTPLSTAYPPENQALQEAIGAQHLLVSQVPFQRYFSQAVPQNRLFFPERNVTMAALSDATVIVEAGETSGTLIQARAAIHQGRPLFILDNAFRSGLEWPEKFLGKGAVRVTRTQDIVDRMARRADATSSHPH